MDINEKDFEKDKIENFSYRLYDSHYSIYLCPPLDFYKETFAFVVHCPHLYSMGGMLKVYNIEKGTYMQGFLTDSKALLARYAELNKLVSGNKEATLVWEGKIHGFNRETKSRYENPWLT